MSVIGPRPQLVRDMVFMSKEQRMRHTAKPGLSGLAQVNGRNAISWEDKMNWDLKYIKKVTFKEDLKIILDTVKKAFIKQEGISNSLLEAMAVGLPCVSTNHTPGGARLLIADHENGLLAPMGDVHALAGAMCEFADNPELAQKCGNNARDVVNRFEPRRIIDLWEDYIEKLCR